MEIQSLCCLLILYLFPPLLLPYFAYTITPSSLPIKVLAIFKDQIKYHHILSFPALLVVRMNYSILAT